MPGSSRRSRTKLSQFDGDGRVLHTCPSCGAQVEERGEEDRADNSLPAGSGHQPEPLTRLNSERASLLIQGRISLIALSANQVELELFQAFNHSRIQLPRTRGQEAQQSLLRTEIMYFLTRKYTSASYHLIHFSRVVIIIVFVS